MESVRSERQKALMAAMEGALEIDPSGEMIYRLAIQVIWGYATAAGPTKPSSNTFTHAQTASVAEDSSADQEVETDGCTKVVEAHHADDDDEEEEEEPNKGPEDERHGASRGGNDEDMHGEDNKKEGDEENERSSNENTHNENDNEEDSEHKESEDKNSEEKEEEKEKLSTLQSIFKSKTPRSANLKRLRSLCVVQPAKRVKLAPLIDRNDEVDEEENDDDDNDLDLLEVSSTKESALKSAARKQDVPIDNDDIDDNYDDDNNDDNDDEKLLEVFPAKKSALKSVFKKSILKSAPGKTVFLINDDDDDDELDLVEVPPLNKSTTKNSGVGKHRPLFISNFGLLESPEKTAASARKNDILIASLFTKKQKSGRKS